MKTLFIENDDEVVGIKEAAHRAAVSPDTVRRWHRRHVIGRQAGPKAPIEISILALETVRYGRFDVLELLHRGLRDHPDVRVFATHVGLAD